MPNNPAIHTGSKQHENNDYEPILSGVDVGFPWTMGWRAAGLSDQQPSHPAGPGSVPSGGSVMFRLTVDAVAGMWRSGRYPSVSSLASSPSMSTVMVPKKLTLSWWVGHRWASTSSWIRWPPARISAMARP